MSEARSFLTKHHNLDRRISLVELWGAVKYGIEHGIFTHYHDGWKVIV